MLFTESFITDVGKTLLARSVAQEGKLIWTDAKTSNANMDNKTISQMNALTDILDSVSDSYTSAGAVTSAIVNDEQSTVTLYSETNNRDYSGVARVYGAWAKIEGDLTDTLVIVARCGSGVTPTTINPYSVGYEKFFIDCAILISAEQANAIEVSETNYYASNAALNQEIEERQALASRVVTCHVAGQATTGEAQSVYGYKRFENGLFANELSVANTSYLNKISLYSAIYPVHDHAGSIGYAGIPGLDDRIFGIAYIDNIGELYYPSQNIFAENVGYTRVDTIDGVATTVGTNFKGFNADIKTIVSQSIESFQTTQTIGGVTKLLPYNQPESYGNAKIGETGNEFSQGYINHIITDKIEPKTANGTIGDDTKFYLIKSTNVIATNVSATDVSATDFHGCIPYPPENVDINDDLPVGCIVVLRDASDDVSSAASQLYVGDIFDCSHAQGSGEQPWQGYKNRFHLSSLDGALDSYNSPYPLTTGIFVCLSPRLENHKTFLAMKIGEST